MRVSARALSLTRSRQLRIILLAPASFEMAPDAPPMALAARIDRSHCTSRAASTRSSECWTTKMDVSGTWSDIAISPLALHPHERIHGLAQRVVL
jgi:hypothetical protein